MSHKSATQKLAYISIYNSDIHFCFYIFQKKKQKQYDEELCGIFRKSIKRTALYFINSLIFSNQFIVVRIAVD